MKLTIELDAYMDGYDTTKERVEAIITIIEDSLCQTASHGKVISYTIDYED